MEAELYESSEEKQKQDGISRFLDEDGKIRQLPSKEMPRRLILNYLAAKFVCGKDYTEKQVNAIISEWHTFNDYFILRRELIEHKLLSRTTDGSRYWKEK